jgi:NADH-quinone oxidoreductase subunit C
MTPTDVAAVMVERLGEGVTVEDAYDACTVDVPLERWVEAATVARDDERLAATFFDWLSAVDELDAGFAVVVHLWSVAHRHHVFLRTPVPRDAARVPTLTGVFAGAAWHERETHEMFGIAFDGHPGLAPLLLPEGFEGHPLRKEFVLASRVAKEWPGAREPGESHREGAPKRSRMRPPGVPEPGSWGPSRDAG